MNLEQDLNEVFATEIARELILEKNPVLNDALFSQTMSIILGPNGSGNAFDAPILYALLKLKDK